MADLINRRGVRWAMMQQITTSPVTAPTDLSTGFPWYARNDPELDPAREKLDDPQINGLRYEEDNQQVDLGDKPVISGLEGPWNAYVGKHLLAAFFQSWAGGNNDVATFALSQAAATGGSDVVVQASDSFNGADATGYAPAVLAIARVFTSGAATVGDHLLYGAVPSSITIRGEAGGIWTVSADFVGLRGTFTTEITLPSAGATTFGQQIPFSAFGGATSQIQLDGSDEVVKMVEITMTNGATPLMYNESSPGRIAFAPTWNVTGNLGIMWDVDGATFPQEGTAYADFAAGTAHTFQVSFGDGTTDPNIAGEWTLESRFLMNGPPVPAEGDTLYDITIPFRGSKGADGGDGITEALKIVLHDGSDWS